MSHINLLAIDLAKSIFQIHGIDMAGKVLVKRRLRRSQLVEYVANLRPCIIAMEACSGANHWARKFCSFGHTIKLISPQFVKPFVKSNKTDRNDAEAISEAASRPSMRFVNPKTVEQQDIQSLHRIRERLVGAKTAIINQIRGLLSEFGIIMPQGPSSVKKMLPDILEDAENELSFPARDYLQDLYEQLKYHETKITHYDQKLEIIYKEDKLCQKISKIPGIGILTATAIVMTIGDGTAFKNGRQLSAYLGLVPKQHSSGNKQRLLGISKRGDGYLRTLLVHGARSVVLHCDKKADKRSKWVQLLKERKGWNKTAVAVANKNARAIWAVLTKDEEYKAAA